RWRAIRVNGVELLVDVGKLFGLGRLQCGVERFTPRIGGENRVEQACRCRRVLLIDRSNARGFRQQDITAERNEIADNELEQSRFPYPVAPDQSDFGA